MYKVKTHKKFQIPFCKILRNKYTWRPITQTKIDFPWISLINIHYNFTLRNSNRWYLKRTAKLKQFLFPLKSFLDNFTLDSQAMFWECDKSEKKSNVMQSKTLNFFQNNLALFVCTSLSVQFKDSVQPWILFKLCCFNSFFKNVSIYLLLPLKCAW